MPELDREDVKQCVRTLDIVPLSILNGKVVSLCVRTWDYLIIASYDREDKTLGVLTPVVLFKYPLRPNDVTRSTLSRDICTVIIHTTKMLLNQALWPRCSAQMSRHDRKQLKLFVPAAVFYLHILHVREDIKLSVSTRNPTLISITTCSL